MHPQSSPVFEDQTVVRVMLQLHFQQAERIFILLYFEAPLLDITRRDAGTRRTSWTGPCRAGACIWHGRLRGTCGTAAWPPSHRLGRSARSSAPGTGSCRWTTPTWSEGRQRRRCGGKSARSGPCCTSPAPQAALGPCSGSTCACNTDVVIGVMQTQMRSDGNFGWQIMR
jgi:hypothetical protein